MKKNNKYELPSKILLFLGFVDLVRGFLHTFSVNWSATTFAGLNLSVSPSDQLVLLGAFGISNLLTGFIYILISRKAKKLSPYTLGLIPLAYFVGYIGLKLSGVTASAAFYGRYFMLVYLAVCLFTFGIFIFNKNS